jgi:hypothetical protein
VLAKFIVLQLRALWDIHRSARISASITAQGLALLQRVRFGLVKEYFGQGKIGYRRETSLRSRALALRRVPPLLVIEVIDPLQHSEIALITAGFNMNASVLAKWNPGEIQRPGRKRQPAARQRSHRDLLAFLISEARAHTHRFCPSSLKNAVREESWSQLHSEVDSH